MNLELENKVAVVTGGANGIGFEIAKAFLKEKAIVVIASRNETALKKAVDELSIFGEVYYEIADMTEETSVYTLAQNVCEKYKSLDIWVNNVGGSKLRSTDEEYTEEDIIWTEKICFNSVVYGGQAAFRYMKETGGAIVNISSLAARCGTVGRSTLYGPLKSAVKELTVYQAGEFCAHNIRVNCVMPGFTLTEKAKATISDEDFNNNSKRTLLRRMAAPEEIAYPVVFLASSKASYITGTTLEVSGGRDIVLNPEFAYNRINNKH